MKPPNPARRRRDDAIYALAVVAVWATIGFARPAVASLREAFGASVFLWMVGAGLLAAMAFAWRGVRGTGMRAQAVVVGTALLLAALAWTLRAQPVEALHLLEYAGLGWLGFRAVVHRDPSRLAFATAALLGAGAGIVDEAIQWATPGRVFDLRDLAVNAMAATLAQVPVAVGIRPRWLGAAGVRGRRLFCRVGLGVSLLLGLVLAATPQRLAWVGTHVPGTTWLLAHPDTFLEYGVLHVLPDGTRYRSRFGIAELRETDRTRAAGAGAALAAGADEADYEDFLAHATVTRDPFLHEARVHLFRRDRYLLTAERHRDDPAWRARDLAVALAEDAILEHGFGHTLAAAGLQLDPATRARWSAAVGPGRPPIESRVSAHLITRVDEAAVLAGPALAFCLFAGGLWAARQRA